MDRKKLTFEQAEGAAPLPSQLELKEISPQMRAMLFAFIHEDISVYDRQVKDPWRTILEDHHVYRLHRMIDEFDSGWLEQREYIKHLISGGDYLAVLGFLQWVMRHPSCPSNFSRNIDRILSISRAAYRVVDGKTIAPISSPEEKDTLDKAFSALRSPEFNGAREHLRKAAEQASAGQWADSVRESVHAVEATARTLAPGAKGLEPALQKLEQTASIHAALKRGFAAIYGFTSDEKGIRHPLLDEANAKVDEVDALFMLGACAAFVSYLINKGRKAGLSS
jgi:hypothetical protein